MGVWMWFQNLFIRNIPRDLYHNFEKPLDIIFCLGSDNIFNQTDTLEKLHALHYTIALLMVWLREEISLSTIMEG